MRILHFADLHLGVENYGRIDPATGLHTRLLDFLRSFDFIVDFAVSQAVDLVLFCGDAFRAREPSPTLQYLFAERIKRLGEAGIPVLLLLGNHDLPPLPGRRSALELYPILQVPEVTVVTTPGLHEIATPSGALQVACLPASYQSEESTQEAVFAINAMAQQINVDAPAILAAHISIKGARVGTEGKIGLGRELVLPREAVAFPQFQYVALGHVHSFQDLNPKGAPPLVYSGSPERVDFSEAHEPKGFVLIEIDKAASGSSGVETWDTQYRFVETPARKFVSVDVELETGDGTVDVLEALAEQDTAEAVVKVTVRSAEEILLDDREIRRALEEAAFLAPLNKETEKPPERLRAPHLAQGWEKPLAALEQYLQTTRFSAERKAQLKQAAQELLSKEQDSRTPESWDET